MIGGIKFTRPTRAIPPPSLDFERIHLHPIPVTEIRKTRANARAANQTLLTPAQLLNKSPN